MPPARRLWRILRTTAIILCLLCLALAPVFARAGGAGGGSSGSSGGSSGGSYHSSGGSSGSSEGAEILLWLVFQVIRLLYELLGPIPATLVLLAAGGLIFLAVRHQLKQRSSALNYLDPRGAARSGAQSGGDSGPDSTEAASARSAGRGLAELQKAHPDFSLPAFQDKVTSAFIKIQQAWSQQDLGPVRRFISDGVYQRFTTQFALMALLEQKNLLEQISIKRLQIQEAYRDGPFDVIQVAITASMKDTFTSPLLPRDNQSGHQAFTEYWSFVRRTDIRQEGLDIYQNTQCPHCGAQLPADLGESGQCPYCHSHVNSGEFDWVLSEITQEQDRAAEQAILRGLNLDALLRRIRKADPEFSVQLAEDKASNAWFQILRARVEGRPECARRFVADGYYERLVAGLPAPAAVVPGTRRRPGKAYNRLFLNQVLLGASFSRDDWDYLDFFLTASYETVEIRPDGSVRKLDLSLKEEQSVLRLKRRSGPAGTPKGKLYQHQCSSCGAPVQDSADPVCPYCSQAYNSGVGEWIVDDLVPRSAYKALDVQAAPRRRLDPDRIDELYDVKDYAVNNLMIMAAADGVFDPAEREALGETIRRLHYPASDLDALFNLARTGQLRLKMPHDVRKRQKIIGIMEDLARADGELSPEEQQILDSLKGMVLSENPFAF